MKVQRDLNTPSTLIATLGGQPQIVTFTLDLLLARGESIDQVVIIYLASGPRYQQSYRRLMGEFTGDRYRGKRCHLRAVAVRLGSTALADARTPHEVEAIRQACFNLLAELKVQGHRIHLSLTGGRRIMSLTALAAAMQHLTPIDCLWHIYTPPELEEQAQEGAIMHAPPGADLHLIAVPFVPWVSYFPGLQRLLERPSTEGRGAYLAWMDDAEKERCLQVWNSLSLRQREVLRLISAGMTRQKAADKLGIAITTVDTHRNDILVKCREVWEPPEGVGIDMHFLRQHFGPFFASIDDSLL